MASKKKPASRTPKPKTPAKRTVKRASVEPPDTILAPEAPPPPPPAPEPPGKRPATDYNEQYLRSRGRWEDGLVFEQTAENLHRVVKTLGLDFNAKILDIGCGRGFIVRHLNRMGFLRALGLEYGNTANIHRVATIARIDLTKRFDFDPDIVDFLYCFDALDGIPRECIPSALVEIRRITVPGGHLLTQLLTELTTDRDEWRKKFAAAGWTERRDLEPLLIDLGYNRSPDQWMAIWRKT